jgi:hypothetical protein
MQIFVVFNDEKHEEATVEFRPSWFARKVLRRRSNYGVIARDADTPYTRGKVEVWRWTDTGREVSSEIRDAIDVRPEEVWDFERMRDVPKMWARPKDEAK